MNPMTMTIQVEAIEGLETNTNNGITVTSEAKTLLLAESNQSTAVSITVGNLDLRLKDDGTYKVVSRGDVPNQEIIIPSEFNNSTVTEIAVAAFTSDTTLTKITIPSTVTIIGPSAFSNCSNLFHVIFETEDGDDLQIGATAFSKCTSLKDVAFPTRLTSIGKGAFKGCTKLEQVYHADVTADNRLMRIGDEAFMDCTGLSQVQLGNGVEEIGNYAFSGCSVLSSYYFDIPTTCTKIGVGAFKNCYEMTAFTLPESLVFIGVNAFINDPRPEGNYTRAIKFVDPYTWFTSLSSEISYSDLTLQLPTKLFDKDNPTLQSATNLMNGSKLSLHSEGNLGGFYWHKFKQMPTPEISLKDGVLSMTDPLGVADNFYIYVNGKKKVTIHA